MNKKENSFPLVGQKYVLKSDVEAINPMTIVDPRTLLALADEGAAESEAFGVAEPTEGADKAPEHPDLVSWEADADALPPEVLLAAAGDAGAGAGAQASGAAGSESAEVPAGTAAEATSGFSWGSAFATLLGLGLVGGGAVALSRSDDDDQDKELTESYTAAILEAVQTLDAKIMGEDFDPVTDASSLAMISGMLRQVGNDVAQDLADQFSALTNNYNNAVGASISNLDKALKGDGFIAGTDLDTFKAVSDAIALLNADDATEGSVANDLLAQFNTLTDNYEAAISNAISDLNGTLKGDGFIAGTDLDTFKAVSDAIALLNADDQTEGSVANDLLAQFNTLTDNYEAAIGTAISDLEIRLQGDSFDASTDLTTFEVISDAIALLNSDDQTEGSVASDLLSQFNTLTSNYEAKISEEIADLEAKLQGDNFDATTDLATFEAISDTLDGLSDLLGGNELVAGQDDVLTRLDELATQVASALSMVGPLVASLDINPDDGSVQVSTTQTSAANAASGVRIYSGSTLVGSSIDGDVDPANQMFVFDNAAGADDASLFVFQPAAGTEAANVNLSFRATTATADTEGSDGVPSNTFYNFDNVAPGAPTIVGDAIVSREALHQVTGSAEAGAQVTLYVEGEGESADTAVGTATANQDGQWFIDAKLGGQGTLKAVARDAAGNVSQPAGGDDVGSDTLAFTVNANWADAAQLSRTALEVFGSEEDQSQPEDAIVGFFLVGDASPNPGNAVYLSDLDQSGEYIVPDGGQYLGALDFIRGMDTDADLEDLVFLGAGETVRLDQGDEVVIEGLMGEDSWVVSASGFVALSRLFNEGEVDSYVEYLLATSVPVDSYLNRSASEAGEAFSASFLSDLAGYDLSTVPLEIDGALTVAQAVALQEAGFNLADNVSYRIDDSLTTVQAARANPNQNAVLQNAEQVIAEGNELNNQADMAAFDDSVNLRSELDEGDDSFNAGRGDEAIVGGKGADVINLTTKDNSSDAVIYQNISDGAQNPAAVVRFSDDPMDYREGSVLTLTINGHEYSYTVSSDDGDTTIDDELVADELAAFAEQLRAQTVIEPDHALVGFLVDPMSLGGEDVGFTDMVTLDDLSAESTYTVPQGRQFVSAFDLATFDISDLGFEYFYIGSPLKTAGETIDFSGQVVFGLDVYDALLGEDSPPLPTDGPGDLSQVSLPASSVESFLTADYLAREYGVGPFGDDSEPTADQLQEAREAVAEFAVQIGKGGALTGVEVTGDNGLVLYGQVGEPLTVTPGGDVEAAIENSGLVTTIDVNFSTDAADYPGKINEGNTTEFDRELSVTINSETYSALVVEGDPEASVQNLADAIQAEISRPVLVRDTTTDKVYEDDFRIYVEDQPRVSDSDPDSIIVLSPLFRYESGATPEFTLVTDLSESNTFALKNASDFNSDKISDSLYTENFGTQEVVINVGDRENGEDIIIHGFTLGSEEGRSDILRLEDIENFDDLLTKVDSIQFAKNLTSYNEVFINKEFLSAKITFKDGFALELVDVIALDVVEPDTLTALSQVIGDGSYGASVDDENALGNAIEYFIANNTAFGSDLSKVLDSAAANGTTLELVGAVIPEADANAPTFSVNSAAIDQPGVQQETVVTFSSDNADYYEGGSLSVEVAGKTVTADMVAGDAAASIESLKTNISAAASEVDGALNGILESATFGIVATDLKSASGVIDGNKLTYSFNQALSEVEGLELEDAVQISFSIAPFEINVNNEWKQFGQTLIGRPYDSIADWVMAFNTEFDGSAVASFDATSLELTFDVSAMKSASSVNLPLTLSTNNSYSLALTAATEEPDPLAVSAKLGYEGEVQKATFELEDALQYTELADGTDTVSGARVYYEGGKAHVTINSVGEDGNAGQSVTVSADMATGSQNQFVLTAANSLFTEDMSFAGVSTTSLLSKSKSAFIVVEGSEPEMITLSNDMTVADFLTELNQLESVELAALIDGEIVITIENATVDNGQDVVFYAEAPFVFEGSGTISVNGTPFLGLPDPNLSDQILGDSTSLASTPRDLAAETSQALVDAINAKINGVEADETPAVVTIEGDFDAEMLFSGPSSEVSTISVSYSIASDGRVLANNTTATWRIEENAPNSGWVFTDEETTDSPTLPDLGDSNEGGKLADLLGYISGLEGIEDAVVNDEGDIVITSTGTGGDTSLAFEIYADYETWYQANGEDYTAEGVDVGGTTGTGVAPDALLSELLESASLGEDGTVTLTGKQPGKETFEISDVMLDYQGVQQKASVSLSGEDSDYYEGGTVSLEITPTGDSVAPEKLTVTADMVANQYAPNVLTLTAGDVDLTEEMVFTGEGTDGDEYSRFILNPDGLPQKRLNIYNEAYPDADATTVGSFITRLKDIEYIKNAVLEDGDIKITFADELTTSNTSVTVVSFGKLEFGDNVLLSGETEFSSTTQITQTPQVLNDAPAETAQALVDAINVKINGIPAVEAPAVVVIEGEFDSSAELGTGSGITLTYDIVSDGDGLATANSVNWLGGSGLSHFIAVGDGDHGDLGVGSSGSTVTAARVSDLLAYIEGLEGIASAVVNETGDIVITSTGTGSDTFLDFTIEATTSAWDSMVDGEDWNNTYTANGDAVGSTTTAAVAAVADFANLLESAALGEDGNILLTSKDGAEHAFDITKAQLSNEPVKEQATITFSDNDSDYFNDGESDVNVTTDGVGSIGVTINEVDFEQEMVDGDRNATLKALRDQIDAAVNGSVGEGEPAVVTLAAEDGSWTTGSGALNSGFVNWEGGQYTSSGFVVEKFALSVVSGANDLFLGSFSRDFSVSTDWSGSNEGDFTTGVPGMFGNLGGFVAFLDGLTDGNNNDLLNVSVSDSGALVIETVAVGSEVYLNLNTVISSGYTESYQGGEDSTQYFNSIGPEQKEGTLVNFAGEDTGADGQPVDGNSLLSHIGSVALSGEDSLVLTAKEAQFDSVIDIEEVFTDIDAVAQVTELDTSFLDDSHFYTSDDQGNGGTLTVTIAGEDIKVDMSDTKSATLTTLKNRLDELLDGQVDQDDQSLSIALKAAVAGVSLSGSVLTLTAVKSDTDPMKASGEVTTPYINGELQQGEADFSVTALNSEDILDETITVTVDGVISTLAIDQTFLDNIASGTSQAEAIVAALKSQIESDHGDTSSLGTVAFKKDDDSNDITDVLVFTASGRGANSMGEVLISVTENDGVDINQQAVAYEQPSDGVDDVESSSLGLMVYSLTGIGDSNAVSASGETRETITSEDEINDGDLNFDEESVTGEGPWREQTVTNAGLGEDENSDYLGDNALLGEDSGVAQTYTNPDSAYAAEDASPQFNGEDTSTGDSGLFGSDPGFYEDDGLSTEYLNGGEDSNLDELFDSQDGTAIDDRIVIADGSPDSSGGLAGENSTRLTDSTTGDDDFDIETDDRGFAEFEWDDAWVSVLSGGSEGYDTINNFQVIAGEETSDLIAVEGSLAGSTVSGEVEAVMVGEDLPFSDFDFSEDEFAVVQSDVSGLTADDLGSAERVAYLLNDVLGFSMGEDFGTTDNGDLNTSVFAVTAEDDDSQTAIWSHRQSSSNDDSVEAGELTLLARVTTTGVEEFGYWNFAVAQDDGSYLRPDESIQPIIS